MTPTETDWGPGGYATTPAEVPGVPTFEAHDSSSITIDFTTGDNASVVVYAIWCVELSKWAGADLAVDEASEVWRTKAQWGIPALTGFVLYSGYTFKVKAKDEAGVVTALSAASASMNLLPDVDYGDDSDIITREVTGGAIRVSGTPVQTGTMHTIAGGTTNYYHGNITLTYILKAQSAISGRVVIEYSEDGTSWATATEVTGAPSQGLVALAASVAGTSHIFVWNSYEDAGESEQDAAIYLRVRPYDATPTGGDEGPSGTTAAFALDNRPAQMEWENADGYEWDEDTTPVFRAIIPSFRGGTHGYPMLQVYSDVGASVQVGSDHDSVEDQTGWEYETAPNTWVAIPASGIPDTAEDGVNRVRYTIQAGDALTADPTAKATTYYIKGKMGEVRDRG